MEKPEKEKTVDVDMRGFPSYYFSDKLTIQLISNIIYISNNKEMPF